MTSIASRSRAGLLLVTGALLAGCGPSAPSLTDAELAQRAGAIRDAATPLQRIAFGSCNRTDLPQPLWEPIGAAEPDLWIWLGDNIYADTDDMGVMRAMYEDQLAQPGYARLRETTRVLGIWDDHDYGVNDGGKEYPARAESQVELLDFLGEPRGSARRGRAGVYTSYVYGEAPNRTKIILLDTRYHRDAPGAEGDILGEAQWAWLQEQLNGSDAQLHLIGGGIQFLPEDHRHEKWAEFPTARARLFDVIAASGAANVILLSGDRHISEISRVDDSGAGYPLYEVTSSGMTHSWADNPGEVNRHRVGEMYTLLSFGVIEVDWAGGTVSLQLRAEDGSVAVEEVVGMALPRRQR